MTSPWSAHTSARHQDFTPDQEISAICWWDTAGPPPSDTQIIDTTLAQYTRLGQHPAAG